MGSATKDTERTPKSGRLKLLAFWLVLFAIIAGVLEVSAALILRKTRGYDGRHLLQYAFDPYKSILPTPNYRDTRGVSYNSVGFRRTSEVTVARPPQSLRIFLMGASTAHGTGGLWPHIEPRYPVLADSTTIDSYLERTLRAEHPGLTVEVINAAIPSTWTHHGLIYLNQSILRYHPDIVLFLDGFNDFFFCNRNHDQFARYAYGERATTIMGPPTLNALIQANGWWLARRSAFAYLGFRTAQSIGYALDRPGERPPIDVEDCLAGVREVFPKNALAMWRRSAVTLAAEGVDGVFMLQPLLIIERDRPGLTEVERRLLEFDVQSWRQGQETYMRRAVPWVSDTARKTVTATGASYIDLTGAFASETTQVFTDYAHLTPRGNQIVAAIIADTLRPIIARRLARP